jgi:hypothetical protein
MEDDTGVLSRKMFAIREQRHPIGRPMCHFSGAARLHDALLSVWGFDDQKNMPEASSFLLHDRYSITRIKIGVPPTRSTIFVNPGDPQPHREL